MDTEKKTAQQLAEEHTAQNLLDFIFAKTYARHATLSEQDFLKEIGFDGAGKTEDEAVRIARFNAIIAITEQVFALKQSVRMAKGIIETYVKDENIIEKENK